MDPTVAPEHILSQYPYPFPISSSIPFLLSFQLIAVCNFCGFFFFILPRNLPHCAYFVFSSFTVSYTSPFFSLFFTDKMVACDWCHGDYNMTAQQATVHPVVRWHGCIRAILSTKVTLPLFRSFTVFIYFPESFLFVRVLFTPLNTRLAVPVPLTAIPPFGPLVFDSVRSINFSSN